MDPTTPPEAPLEDALEHAVGCRTRDPDWVGDCTCYARTPALEGLQRSFDGGAWVDPRDWS